MEYLDKLRDLEAVGAPLEAGGELERQAIQRFKGLLSNFKAPDFRSRIADTYAPVLFFNDTLKTVRRLDQLVEYLGDSADKVEKCTVDFLDLVERDGNYYFRWLMTIRFLKGGEDKTSIGMTHVRFDGDGRVVLHQDYWDSTSGLFEHLPVIGWILKRLKKRF